MRRNFLIATIGVLLLVALSLGLFAWWAHGYAKQRIVAELSRRAAHWGWTLVVEEVELALDGTIHLRGIQADGRHGGRIKVAHLHTKLDWDAVWRGDRSPPWLDLEGLTAYLNRAEIEALRRPPATGDAEQLQRQALPALRISDVDLALATESEIGLVRLRSPLLALSESDGVVRVEVEGQLDLGQQHELSLVVELARGLAWGRVQATFQEPLSYGHPVWGDVEVLSFDIAGGAQAINGSLHGVSYYPNRSDGLEALHIAQVDLALSRDEDGWHPDTLRLFQPQASVDLLALLAGPVGERYPQVVAIAAMVEERFFSTPQGRAAPSEEAPRAQRRRERRQAKGEAAVETRQGATLPGFDLQRIQEELAALPGVAVEEGAINLRVWGGATVHLGGLTFNTSAMGEEGAESKRYAFSLQVREATAEIIFDAVPDDVPSGKVVLRNLAARDLFEVLGMKAPPGLEGNVDFDLALAKAGTAVEVTGHVGLRDVGFYHAMVSELPLRNINADLDVHVLYDHGQESLQIDRLRVRSGPAVFAAEIAVAQVRSEPLLTFRIWAEDVRCEDIPAAIPEGLLATIQDFRVGGTRMEGQITGTLPLKDPIRFDMKVDGFPGDCVPLAVGPHQPEALNDPKYVFVFSQYTTLPEGIAVGPGTKHYVRLEKLPGYVPAVMYLTEDKRFFDHGALRPGLITRAIRLNLTAGRYVYGGSTISQQLVKNLFLTRRKNISRKLEEVFIAWRMEEVVTKERILELYLNCIEFGPDVYGIVQGAKFYFNKTPEALQPIEAAYLASLKVSPRVGGKFYLRGGLPGDGRWWSKRQKKVINTLAENGYISPIEVIASYPWTPRFYYPDPNDHGDFRNQWLIRHKGL